MPRHPRLFILGARYRVSCRVACGEFLFDDPLEADEVVAVIGKGNARPQRTSIGLRISPCPALFTAL
jgi:hypothetical protein